MVLNLILYNSERLVVFHIVIFIHWVVVQLSLSLLARKEPFYIKRSLCLLSKFMTLLKSGLRNYGHVVYRHLMDCLSEDAVSSRSRYLGTHIEANRWLFQSHV